MTRHDITRLLAYTEWANHLVLDACSHLSSEQLHQEFGSGHHTIFETLIHVYGADRIWLERWRGVVPQQFATSKEIPSLEELRSQWSGLEKVRSEFLSSISDATLNDQLSYLNLKGERFSQPLIDQMQHVVNHSTHHRGQVVAFIRSLGVKPPNTDLINYFRTVE